MPVVDPPTRSPVAPRYPIAQCCIRQAPHGRPAGSEPHGLARVLGKISFPLNRAKALTQLPKKPVNWRCCLTVCTAACRSWSVYDAKHLRPTWFHTATDTPVVCRAGASTRTESLSRSRQYLDAMLAPSKWRVCGPSHSST